MDGPPFDTATAMTAGSAANTVIWYTGEAGSDPARSTATARIDPSLSVSYGARANEDGIRTLVQNIATLAAVTVSPTDPNGADLSAALNQRLTANLNGTAGTQTVTDIETDLASAQTSLNAAKKPASADHRDAERFSATDRRRVERGSRRADPHAADPHAGLDADHRDAVPDQPGQLPNFARK